MPRLTAVATLPFADAKVAASALRGRLTITVAREGADPEWDTLRITGPRPHRDARGTEWFDWVATVEVREAPAEVPPRVLSARPTVADLGILRRRAS